MLTNKPNVINSNDQKYERTRKIHKINVNFEGSTSKLPTASPPDVSNVNVWYLEWLKTSWTAANS